MAKPTEPSRLERLLTVIFAALFFLNVGYLLLGVASIPLFYERVTKLTIEPITTAGQDMASNALVEQEAASRGVTLSQFALEQILFSVAFVLVFGIVAALIAWRAGNNWFAWYSAFLLVFLAEAAFDLLLNVARLVPQTLYAVNALFWPLVLLYLFLFPNGKPVPRRALWLVGPLILFHFFFQASFVSQVFFPNSAFIEFLTGLVGVFGVVIPLAFVIVLVCQVYRYFRVSTPIEKQQTKWFLFGLVLTVATIPITSLFEDSPYVEEMDLITFVFVPLAVGVAILRYRLWDIDVIIRRTLTYALVTALLLVVFFGSVIVLQQVFAGITGSGQNEIVTVLSTLAIAALFVPVRNWIQNTIDRRFNRQKYDAQQILNDFATTVRDETDLEKLTARLMQVVDETMQPKSLSVWLKMDKSKRPFTQE